MLMSCDAPSVRVVFRTSANKCEDANIDYLTSKSMSALTLLSATSKNDFRNIFLSGDWHKSSNYSKSETTMRPIKCDGRVVRTGKGRE
jgi:hypothetical protein